MENRKKEFVKYVNAAEDLAAAVKDNIQHGAKITPETMVALNDFTIASNAVKDMTDVIIKDEPKQH